MTARSKLVVTCLLAAVAVGLLVRVVWPKHGPLGKRAAATLCVCATCGHEGNQTLKSVPDMCPSCHQKQMYPAVKCPYCGAANAAAGATGPQRRVLFLTCRRCGRQFNPARLQ